MFALCFVPCTLLPSAIGPASEPLDLWDRLFLDVICFSSHYCSFFASPQQNQSITESDSNHN